MTFLQSVEAKFDEVFVKNAPFQLSESLQKWLAEYAWLFALLSVVLGGFALLALLPLLGIASVLTTAVGRADLLPFMWLAFAGLAAYVAVLAMAVTPLKEKRKRGWDLLFYSTLLFFVYDVFRWVGVADFGRLFGLVWNVLWLVFSLYFLFQVKKYFVVGKVHSSKKS